MTTSSASVKAVGELVQQQRGARVHVRLEDRPQAAVGADLLARGGEGGAHLGRVVAVVVVDRHRRSIGDQLHAPPGSGERAQPLGQQLEVGAERAGHDQRRRGVEHVVLPRQASSPTRGRTGVKRVPRGRAARRWRRLAAGPVAQDAPVPAARGDAASSVAPGSLAAISSSRPSSAGCAAHAAHEALEGVHHRRRIGEVVGMIHLDVGDDGAGGVVVEEVVAELVGLDQERRSPTRPDRCAPRADEGADLDRRVQPGADEQVAEQRGRRRLAVRAGDAEADAPRRRLELAEQRLPGDDRDAALASAAASSA